VSPTPTPIPTPASRLNHSLLLANAQKDISNDQERIDQKGFDEFPLEKSECAEQQANDYEGQQQYGERAFHDFSGSDNLGLTISGDL